MALRAGVTATLAGLALLATGCHRHRARGRQVRRHDAAVTVADVPTAVTHVADAAVDGGLAAALDLVPGTLRARPSIHDGEDFLVADWPSTLPTSRPPSPRCRVDASATLWLSHEPHVPLARVTARGIERAGHDCCRPFAVQGTRWREIDRWGQVVGESTLRDGQYYDVTDCDELTLVPEHHASSGLYASASGPWRPPPSARHDPDSAQWAAALTLDDRLHARESPDLNLWGKPLHHRALFFHATEGRDDTAPGVWLALGRYDLVVARWERGDWRVERVRLNDEGMRVTPVAVFDLDGDGFPEIVAEEDGGDSWDSVILKRSAGGVWTRVATSVNGSTA